MKHDADQTVEEDCKQIFDSIVVQGHIFQTFIS